MNFTRYGLPPFLHVNGSGMAAVDDEAPVGAVPKWDGLLMERPEPNHLVQNGQGGRMGPGQRRMTVCMPAAVFVPVEPE